MTQSQPSAFNSLIKNQTENPDQPNNIIIDSGVAEIFDKNGGELKNVPYGLNIFLLGLSIMEFNHEAVWDYTNTPFWAEIVSASKDTTSLTLKFISPKSIPYLNEQKEVIVVGCEKYNSFLTIKNPESILGFWYICGCGGIEERKVCMSPPADELTNCGAACEPINKCSEAEYYLWGLVGDSPWDY